MKAKNYQAVIRQPNVTFERHKLLNNKRERERKRDMERILKYFAGRRSKWRN